MSNNEKSGGSTEPGAAKRPHATLDMSAETVDDGAPDTPRASDEGAETRASDDAQRARSQAQSRRSRPVTGFIAYLAAAVLGGIIALTAGFYTLDAFRDRLPFATQTSTERISQQQQALEQQLAQIQGQAQAARSELREQISALDTRTEGLTRADNAGLSALSERVDALAQQVEAAGAAQPPAPQERLAQLDQRIVELSEELQSLRGTLEQVRAQNADQLARSRAASIALALGNMRRALDRGVPFKLELEALRRLSRQPIEAKVLAAQAEDGVPTVQAMRANFPDYARRALEASKASGGDNSIIDQLVDSARSVVNVRPLGEIEGDGPGATIARIENRLKAGDLTGAIEQTDALSGEAAVQLLPWVEQVKTRIAAQKEMEAVETRFRAVIDG